MIKYVVLDIDGTLTDGKIYYLSSGEEMKAFNIKDGLAISFAQKQGINIIIITGREGTIVERRMRELGVTEIYQGIGDKKAFMQEYFKEKNIDLKKCAYIGDDLNDLGSMRMVGFSACPNDACQEIKEMADYISKKDAGDGAVREIIEHIMKKNHLWEQVVMMYI